jgi:hypothetical protein
MLRAVVLAGVAALYGAPAIAAPLDWLVGRWCTEAGAVRTCEHWSRFRGGAMQGGAATTRDGKVIEREEAAIRVGSRGLIYIASPEGRPAVTFREARSGRQSILFENRAHDYPQRIRYWRSGADLMAEIALADGSKARRWRYRPVR